jgi:hypothetical protein
VQLCLDRRARAWGDDSYGCIVGVQDLVAQKDRSLIDRDRLLVDARSALDVSKLRAETEHTRAVASATAELESAATEAKQAEHELIESTGARCSAAKIEVCTV